MSAEVTGNFIVVVAGVCLLLLGLACLWFGDSLIELGGVIAMAVGIVFIVVPFCDLLSSEIPKEKLDYAVDNGYSFYLDGEDVTDQIDYLDFDQYSISFDNYDDGEILMTHK